MKGQTLSSNWLTHLLKSDSEIAKVAGMAEYVTDPSLLSNHHVQYLVVLGSYVRAGFSSRRSLLSTEMAELVRNRASRMSNTGRITD